MAKQHTIQKSVSFSGRGLHSGNESTVTFRPAPADSGVVFYRVDLPGRPAIPADIEHVVDISRGTTIGLNGIKVLTIEHVLAALVGLEIDNVAIELDANELPVGDGSAKPFVDALIEAGTAEQDADRMVMTVSKPVTYRNDDITITLLPSDEFRLSFTIDYPHYPKKVVGTQFLSEVISKKDFERDIAPARTFCSMHEVEALQSRGLIKGGSLENAIVIGDEDILNEALRFSDELVRHKMLDLLGDLFLLGRPLEAHVIAIKSGHAAHIEFARMVRDQEGGNDRRNRRSGPRVSEIPQIGRQMDISEIRGVLPHRYPFLLVDRIDSLVEGKRATGIKSVTANEEFFQGHWPDMPVMPGVLIIEAMAQVGGVLVLKTADLAGTPAFFSGVDKARFRKAVRPGDQLVIEVDLVRLKSRFSKVHGRAYVDGALAAEADLMFSLKPTD